ncbi:glycosyltransferase [Candidatus Poribacteria bacterium]|nr:glycosyltransferase [Candidatus Poribacteria bacterium]
MHILFINQYFYPDRAATAQLLTELCLSLSDNHNISVLCGAPSYNPVEQYKVEWPFKQENYNGVNVFRVSSTGFSRVNMVGRSLNYISYMTNATISSIFVGKPDVLVAMTDPPIAGLIGSFMKKRLKIPMVLIVNDLHPDIGVALGKLRSSLVINSMDKAVKHILKSADHVVAIGHSMQKRILAKGISNDKISIIPNWADVEAIKPQAKINKFSIKHGLVDHFVVMYSGNIGLGQNLSRVIEAADILKQQKYIRFIFIGDGAAKSKLKNMVRKKELTNVTFLSYMPKEMLQYSFSAGDLHLVPLERRLQGFIVPSKVYGIMAAGRPFLGLVDEDSEVAEIVREFNCGFILDPDNPELLANTIKKLSKDPHQLDEIGRRGREAVVQCYNRELTCERYQKLFFNITNGKH